MPTDEDFHRLVRLAQIVQMAGSKQIPTRERGEIVQSFDLADYKHVAAAIMAKRPPPEARLLELYESALYLV